jgi:hypothetical protein
MELRWHTNGEAHSSSKYSKYSIYVQYVPLQDTLNAHYEEGTRTT